MTRPIAIVDPFSGGAMLAPEFRKRGRESVMVQSTPEIPRQFRSSLRSRDFIEIIHHVDDDETLRRLRALDVELVLAGCELGVAPADRWSEALGLISNGARCSAARRDKFTMIEKVRDQGLRAPTQIAASTIEEAVSWTRARQGQPVVVKPLESVGSDSVRACESEAEVVDACAAILGRDNVLGMVNQRVLVQEYLEGTEYVVDTVSRGGRHRLAAVWRYSQPDSPKRQVGYDAMWLMSGRGSRQDTLFAYACDVLDALDIRYGPAHCEVKWVDGEPVLVEIGARLNGGINCWLNRDCGGVCQLDLAIDAYAEPGRFLGELDRRYLLRRHATNVFLKPPAPGFLRSLPRLSEIEGLPSMFKMTVSPKPRPVRPVAGVVTLVHEDNDVIEADLARIRALERDGLYEIVASL